MAGTPSVGSILITHPYGIAGPNFIVREANGYLSREEIVLKHAPDAGTFPEGLVLKLEEVGENGETGVMYVPFDGAGEAAGLLFQMKDASQGDTAAVAVVRSCEVQRAALRFAGEISDAMKEAAYASLAANHVVMR